MGELYSFLTSNNFFIDYPLCNLIQQKLLTKRKAFLLKGPAGTGKTQLTYLISRFMDAKYVFFQCTYGCSEDDLLYKYIPSETTKSGIKITLGPVPLALLASKTQKVVLVLDEFDKTRPSTDALLLDLLQNFRVSLYIDEGEQIIEGDPKNLVIFLTSNEMREFSEPLLRRLTVITLNYLPADKVYQILSNRFRAEIATLLTQIYIDTINAGLRKPATIQELCELGEILENSDEFDLEMLLKSIIIKYDDDWEKYLSYIASREPYQFVAKNTNSGGNVAKYYEPPKDLSVSISSTSEDSHVPHNDGYILQELQKKLKIPVTEREIKAEEVMEDMEVFMIVEDNNHEAYTKIIKTLRPEPSDNPDEFDKFKMYFDTKVVITAKKPLTISELYKLRGSNLHGEFYAESIIPLVDFRWLIDKMLCYYDKVEYYSKNLIRCSSTEKDNIYVAEAEVINRHDENVVDIVMRMYVKGVTGNIPLIYLSEISLLGSLSERTYDADLAKQYANKLLKILDLIANAKNVDIKLLLISDYLYKCKVEFNDAVNITVSFSRSFCEKLKVYENFGVSADSIITDIKTIREVITYIVQHMS